MTIRVLRVLEYSYPDAETMQKDMEHWAVQSVHRNTIAAGKRIVIRSVSFPLDVLPTEPPIKEG